MIRTKIVSFGFSLKSSMVAVEQEAQCRHEGWERVPAIKYIWDMLC